MDKILNPWRNVEGYLCFGCSPDNQSGLKMEFYEDGDEIVSIWQPRPEFQGWLDTLHGGIQAVLLDEICAWLVTRKLQTTGVTSKMETRYRHPVKTNEGTIEIRASLKEMKRNIAIIEARLYDHGGKLCTEAVCTYFTYPQNEVKENMFFLGCETEKTQKKKHKTGIVLSGGGAKGYAHIGALMALEERGIEPSIIAGTSMGAIIGIFYAAGYHGKEIYNIVVEEKFDSLFTVITPVIGISKLGISSHKNVYEVFRKYMPGDDFDLLEKPLAVCATDLVTGEGRYFNSGKHLHDAVIASSSIPGVFEAVKIDNGIYVDGGLIDNLPAKTIRESCEYLIGIDVNPTPPEPPKLENKADLIAQTFHTIVHNSALEGRRLCDFLVEPQISNKYNEFSFKEFKEICNIGHDIMAEFLDNHPEAVEKLRNIF